MIGLQLLMIPSIICLFTFNPTISPISLINIYDANTKEIDDYLRKNFDSIKNTTLYYVNTTLDRYDLAYYKAPRSVIVYSVKYLSTNHTI